MRDQFIDDALHSTVAAPIGRGAGACATPIVWGQIS